MSKNGAWRVSRVSAVGLLFLLLLGSALPGWNVTEAQQQGTQPQTQPVAAPQGQNPLTEEPTSRLADLIRRGATMEEIAALTEPIAKTPVEAIRELKAGNARFFTGVARRPELAASQRRAQILSQTPFAIVLSCSDSRVPTEIVYDQGLGSLFITRVAGNIIEPGTAGSIEYGVEHLKSHVVVVMGHEGCGAVKAAMLPAEKRRAEPESVRFLLDRIVPSVSGLPQIRDEKARMREAVISNVRHQVHELNKNPVIRAAVQRGQIAVIGAYYEITSGSVDFLETEEELRLNR
ncbi:MAG: carbonic anhydrase [Pyrinomonadaceae bacterium]|nr:carbonic anhydrase [Pyrinomonadaceae bacterium]